MYSLVGACKIQNLNGGDKFIRKESLDDFRANKKVDAFLILAEAAYGFYAVNLSNGVFACEDLNELVFKII